MSPAMSPRNSCVLQGALRTATAVEGIVPIVHSTAGCALQYHLAGCLASGGQGGGRVGGMTLPVTNITEKHVIFGGSSRLREQLKNTVRVLDGDLYLVMSGCAPDLVGDDSAAMTDEIKEQGYPAAYLQASGFLGSAYLGYQRVVGAILDFVTAHAEQAPEPEGDLVNLLGIVPGQDSFWQGDLRYLEDSFAAAGITLNSLFGIGQSLDDWKRAMGSSLNVAVSSWGADVARDWETRLGVPFVEWPYVPVGADDTAALIREVSGCLGQDGGRADRAASSADGELAHFLERFADAYFDFGLQSDFAAVGPVAHVVGISRFLASSLGMRPRALVFTDLSPTDEGALERVEYASTSAGHAASPIPILASEDAGEIGAFLRSASGVGLVLGSSLEAATAAEIGAAHLSVSFPVWDRMVLHRGYSGFRGALNLVEDVGSALLRAKRVLWDEERSLLQPDLPSLR